jgi:uncharacterized membrane protein YkoI
MDMETSIPQEFSAVCAGVADSNAARRVRLVSARFLQDRAMETRRMFRIAAPFTLAAALAVAAVVMTVAPPAIAGHHDRDDHVEARALLQRGEILPLSRILQIVQQQVPGDVIEVELDHSDLHGWEYEVKVLTAEGRVREVKLNAGSGVVRKIEDD